MQKDYTHIAILLDRSGSMGVIKNTVIEKYNEFLKTQREIPGEATITLAQFDSGYEVTYDMSKLQEAANLTHESYVMQGMTALNDASAKLINATGVTLAAMKEQDRPSKVLFVTITDGAENASKEHTRDTIKKMVQHQEQKYSWEFIYLGANQDSVTEAVSYGMKGGSALNWKNDAAGATVMFSSLTNATANFRSKGKMSFQDYKTFDPDAIVTTTTTTDKEDKKENEEPRTV